MANRDLLKEAIADAKAVKETAIANAKAALEEAFTPMLREKLAAKIAEMDEVDEEMDLKEADEMEEGLDESYEMDEAKEMDEMKKDMDEAEEKVDEVDLDELLRELDELEEGDVDERLGTINDPVGSAERGNLAEAEKEGEEEGEEAEGEEEEEIDLENMDEGDLKKFIEDVIADMVASGELEGNIEGGEGEEEMGGEEEMDMEMPMAEEKEMDEAKEMEMEAMKKELDEAYAALESVKAELNEVNLLNAKLLYTNKIFKAKNLTESQKVKVLEAFDKATSVKEAKLVYETLSTGVASNAKKPMNESLIRGGASKPAGVSEKKPIMEANDQVARWQKLAGIK